MEVEVYLYSRADVKITEKLLPIIVLPAGGVPLVHSRQYVPAELLCRAVARPMPPLNDCSKCVCGAIT